MDNSELKKVFIFSELGDEDLDNIRQFSRLKSYNKGDIIFFDTEPYLGFYVVIEGMVKVYKISSDGREHIIHLVDRYNTFAEVPLFENSGMILLNQFRYPANAMAIEDNTKVLLIPSRPFIELIESSPRLSMKMISGFAKRLRHLNTHIESITLKDVTKRVTAFIVTEFEKKSKSPGAKSARGGEGENSIKLKISKNDLASYLGTIIETLSRTFKKLQDDGVIEVKGRVITIRNLHKLKELSA
jgi:CRP/FNR family transcriptional regulator